MNKPVESSGSNAGVVILIAILVLAVPCLAGLFFLGAGIYWTRAVQIAPAQPPPPVMVAAPPQVAVPAELVPAQRSPDAEAVPPAASDSAQESISTPMP